MKLIDKDALIAEIERLQDAIKSTAIDSRISKEQAEAYRVCVKLRSFVEDTLEVKEVNLENEAELIANGIMISVQANLYHTNIYNFEKRCFKHSDLKQAARKGIELGLKMQK